MPYSSVMTYPLHIRRTCRVISAGLLPLSCEGPHPNVHRTDAFQRGLQPLTSHLKTAAREPEAEGDTQLAGNKEPGSRARCHPSGGYENSERPGRGFGEPQPITRGPRRKGRCLVPAAAAAWQGPSIPQLWTHTARTWRASGPPREARCYFCWPRRGSRR